VADWFKFFENDLDEIRFQWAVHQLSGVCPVWVGILSECCRHKSDTIRWNDSDHEIWGFGNRLNQTPEVVRESVKLLEKIEYVKREGNMLKVLKWKVKQSEYCQKKDRKNTKDEPENPPKHPESVRTVSGECPPRGEERRGEESIPPVVPQGDKAAGKTDSVELPQRFPATPHDAINQAATTGANPIFITDTWNKAMSRGGRDAKDIPIRNWALYVASELKYERARAEGKKVTGVNGSLPLWRQIEILREQIAKHPANSGSKSYLFDKVTKEQMEELKQMRIKLRELEGT
jgi:hypothetical protein